MDEGHVTGAPVPVPNHLALATTYDRISATVDGLTDADLLRPTRCRGWYVADLLFHLVCDAQRALVALASPADGPADVDAVSYWQSPSDPDEGRHASWVRRCAAAFDRPRGVVRLWTETAPAAVRAAGRADPQGHVATQGHVLAVPEFLATLVTEAVVHHLDLVLELPDAPAPDPIAVDVTVSPLDGLLSDEAVRPADWSPRLRVEGDRAVPARRARPAGARRGGRLVPAASLSPRCRSAPGLRRSPCRRTGTGAVARRR